MEQRTKYLIVYLMIATIGLGMLQVIATLPETFWMDAYSGTHKIMFNITREGDEIHIQYLGGTDSQFIDHLRVEVQDRAGVRQSYHWKPRIGKYIIVPLVDFPANITVSGFLLDTRTYAQLAHADTV